MSLMTQRGCWSFARVLSCVILTISSANAVDMTTTQINLTGSVNNRTFTATGPAQYTNTGDPTAFTNDINYTFAPGPDSLPIWPKIKITLINTWKCTVTASSQGQAFSIFDVTGGTFNYSRNIQVVDPVGTQVGNFTITGTMSPDATDTNLFYANLTSTGTYTGPDVDGSKTSGYMQTLTQDGAGRIKGYFEQTFRSLTDNSLLTAKVNTLWTYTPVGGRPPGLTSTQYSFLNLDSVAYTPVSADTMKLTLAGTGYYSVVPEPSSVILSLCGVGFAVVSVIRRSRIRPGKTINS